MSFSFNFVSNTQHASLSIGADSSDSLGVRKKKKTGKNSSFEWIQDVSQDDEFKSVTLTLDHGKENDHNSVAEGSAGSYVLRVQEESSSFHNRNTDLIPGVYEGGLKVWECSIDLCRYFLRNNVVINGYVLELGCGHGLPGVWILKQAIAKSQNTIDCFVTFSDYNEFVIRDVTIPNVVVNAKDSWSKRFESMSRKNLEHLLNENIAFGSGDWYEMSDLLLGKNLESSSPKQSIPGALPGNGLFDCILASETTYSENSAIETAELLSRHMKPGSGIAYICTKRYYFGVGGGTKCLCDSLNNQKSHRFRIETLEVYDNGAGNIRELLLVKSLGLEG